MLGCPVRKWERERVPCPSGAFAQFFLIQQEEEKWTSGCKQAVYVISEPNADHDS